MQWFLSSPRPGVPISILVGIPDGGQLTGRFIDDGSTRDLTAFVADMLLDGLMLSAATRPAATGTAGVDAVPIADLALSVPITDVHVLLLEPAAGAATALPPTDLLSVVAEGIAGAVTAAVDQQDTD